MNIFTLCQMLRVQSSYQGKMLGSVGLDVSKLAWSLGLVLHKCKGGLIGGISTCICSTAVCKGKGKGKLCSKIDY